LPIEQSLHIPKITYLSDKDDDGVNDLEDIVNGAKAEVKGLRHCNKTLSGQFHF